MSSPAWHLLLHGTVVLLVGLVCGFPFGRAITRGRSEDVVRAWRVAHSGLCMGGTLLIAVAAVLASPLVSAPRLAHWAVVVPLVASGYGFSVGLPIGATVGQRGLTAGGPASNRVVYAGNLIGAGGSLVGVLVLLGVVVAGV